MAREIPKKEINDSTMPDGDFEQFLSQQLEGDAAEETLSGSKPEFGSAPPSLGDLDVGLFDEPPTSTSAGSFSLDSFEAPAHSSAEIDPGPALEESKTQGDNQSGQNVRRRIVIYKLISLVAAGILIIGSLGVATRSLLTSSPAEPLPKLITMVRQPITVPLFEEKLSFLILNTAKDQKDMITLNLELKFNDEEYYQTFRRESILFRDVVYQFLSNQQPSKNTLKVWRQIVKDGLAGHLKQTMPQVQVSFISVDNIEKL